MTTNSIKTPVHLLSQAAARHARYYDFALLGREAGNPASRAVAEAVIFGAGRPTLILPDIGHAGGLDKPAVAWDGSRAAARAVGDAMPFFERASRISVFTVVDEKPLGSADAGERLAASLRKHGFSAEVEAVETVGSSIAETIQKRAIEKECGLLVMGGFGHSRLRDFVLGGMTDGVLDAPLMPVLMSH